MAVQLMAWISSHPVMLRDTLLLIAALRKHAMHDESVRIRGRRKRNSNPTQLVCLFPLAVPVRGNVLALLISRVPRRERMQQCSAAIATTTVHLRCYAHQDCGR